MEEKRRTVGYLASTPTVTCRDSKFLFAGFFCYNDGGGCGRGERCTAFAFLNTAHNQTAATKAPGQSDLVCVLCRRMWGYLRRASIKSSLCLSQTSVARFSQSLRLGTHSPPGPFLDEFGSHSLRMQVMQSRHGYLCEVGLIAPYYSKRC